jgi:hypothetical protein
MKGNESKGGERGAYGTQNDVRSISSDI